MQSGMFRCAVASAMFVISLGCEIAEAADPGFYVGAAGGRSEQSLDKKAGVGPVPPVADATFTPVFVVGRDPVAGIIVGNPGAPIFSPVPVVAVYRLAELTADETDVGWNFSLGYRVNKYLAAELAYVDSGEASLVEHYRWNPSLPPVSDVSEITRSYSVTSRGPALSVLGSLPLGSQWEVFLRGGVLFAKQEVETRVNSVGGTVAPGAQIDRDFSDEVVTVGAGVQWAFLPRWTARLEYQRTDDLQSNEIMGESHIDQASLSVLFGL
ncbi:outer membrane beta-barrel protein [Steroidobacter flavus]|uniref:Outer membrane beta-barrel protein n=1 Tax=Steroidobacter flavus TaxID=1842136 RepID=A0ABV8SW48_9GAMM